MSQSPRPPFTPGAVHVTPAEDDTEFENGPDADIGDPNWNVPPGGYDEKAVGAAITEYMSQPGVPMPGTGGQPETNPLATAEEASRIAGAALHYCDDNHVNLNGKLYLKYEAWSAIANLSGTIPGIETVKDNVLGGIAGITARSTLKTLAGKLLSEAEGFVGNDEPFWVQKPVSDRVNMAQTRAVGRVCRICFSYIVKLINKEYGRNYEVTPAEEMLASQQAAPYTAPVPPQVGQRHVMPTPQPTFPTPQQWPPQVLPPQPQANVIPYQQPQPAPQPGQRHVFQPPQQAAAAYHGPTDPNWNVGQGPASGFVQDPRGQMRQAPVPNVVYPDSHAFVPQPQYPPPNVAPSVGQAGERWQGMISDVRQKMTKDGSPFFIIHLADGHNASTFDKTIAGHAMQLKGQNVEMIAIPRGNGRYNVGQLRPL